MKCKLAYYNPQEDATISTQNTLEKSILEISLSFIHLRSGISYDKSKGIQSMPSAP